MLMQIAVVLAGCSSTAETENQATRFALSAHKTSASNKNNAITVGARTAELNENQKIKRSLYRASDQPQSNSFKKLKSSELSSAPPKSVPVDLEELRRIEAGNPQVDEIKVYGNRSLALATIKVSSAISGRKATVLAQEVGTEIISQNFTGVVVQVINKDNGDPIARAEFRPDHTLEMSMPGQKPSEERW